MKRIKINIYKSLFISGMLVLSFGIVSAQEEHQNAHELSFYGKGVFNSLDYQLIGQAAQNSRHGAGLGIQYAMYLSENWSLSAGLEYQQYRSEVLFSNFSDSYAAIDVEGDNFKFQSSAETYQELQWANMVNIPLSVQYETPSPWKSSWFYASTGIQFGIPVEAKYKATASDLKTAGYYEQWDVQLQDPSFMGFGSWGTVQSSKQELDLKGSYSLLLEVGFKQQLNKTQNLYVGFYAELGLNNLNKNSQSTSALVEYKTENPTDFGFNSILNSSPQAQGETYGTKTKTQGFGFKIQYAFKL